MRSLFMLAVIAFALTACSASPTGPRPTKPRRDVECRSGYVAATRDDGEQVCEEAHAP